MLRERSVGERRKKCDPILESMVNNLCNISQRNKGRRKNTLLSSKQELGTMEDVNLNHEQCRGGFLNLPWGPGNRRLPHPLRGVPLSTRAISLSSFQPLLLLYWRRLHLKGKCFFFNVYINMVQMDHHGWIHGLSDHGSWEDTLATCVSGALGTSGWVRRPEVIGLALLQQPHLDNPIFCCPSTFSLLLTGRKEEKAHLAPLRMVLGPNGKRKETLSSAEPMWK